MIGETREWQMSSNKQGRGNGGGLLLGIGLIGVLLALGMDTTVESTGGTRVHNIGLMNQQQNFLIVCVVVALAGAILLMRGSGRQQPQSEMPPLADGKVCPDCAETVKLDAKVCRFCGNREFGDQRGLPVGRAASAPRREKTWFDSLVWDRTKD